MNILRDERIASCIRVNNLKKTYIWLICQIRVIPTIKTLIFYPLKKNRQLQTPCLGKIPTQATPMFYFYFL
jgi:hypothetical protein